MAQLQADVARLTVTAVGEANRKREQAGAAVVVAACALVAAMRRGSAQVPIFNDRLVKAVQHFEAFERGHMAAFACPGVCRHVDYCGRRGSCQYAWESE